MSFASCDRSGTGRVWFRIAGSGSLLVMSLPTLYKARGVPTKQQVCAICIDRTRGRTQLVKLPYGVSVWLCAGHADGEFLTRRSGRDFVLTLSRIWQASGCYTAARQK